MQEKILYIGAQQHYERMGRQLTREDPSLIHADNLFTALRILREGKDPFLAIVTRPGDGTDLNSKILASNIPSQHMTSPIIWLGADFFDPSIRPYVDAAYCADLTGIQLLDYLQEIYPDKRLFPHQGA